MKHSSFPFHYLPVLVKCKILKQYVPFHNKTFVLSRLPEFCELLDNQYSWLNSFEINLYHILRLLEPGLYWNSEQDANVGYYVVTHAKKISFTLCSINSNTIRDFFSYNFSSELFDNEIMCISIQTMQNFLTTFSNKYFTTNKIQIYKLNTGHYFYINVFTERVHWGEKVYVIKNKKCVIRHSKTETFIINLKQNDIIQLTHYNMTYKPFKRTEEEIEPISLKAYISNLQEKTVYNQRQILEINFAIMEDHVSLERDARALWFTRVRSIYNRTRGIFSSNGVQRMKHTFEELNNLFVPLKSCQCTKKQTS